MKKLIVAVIAFVSLSIGAFSQTVTSYEDVYEVTKSIVAAFAATDSTTDQTSAGFDIRGMRFDSVAVYAVADTAGMLGGSAADVDVYFEGSLNNTTYVRDPTKVIDALAGTAQWLTFKKASIMGSRYLRVVLDPQGGPSTVTLWITFFRTRGAVPRR